MDLRRLRTGDWLTAIAAVALLLLLALEWFSAEVDRPTLGRGFNGTGVSGLSAAYGSASGYSSLGWLMIALLVIGALAGLLLAGLTVSARAPDALPVAVQVLLVPYALLTTLVLVVVLLLQPGLGVGLPNAAVSLRWPAYVGLLAQLALLVGAWLSMNDERTDAKHAAYVPPPARPVPPATV